MNNEETRYRKLVKRSKNWGFSYLNALCLSCSPAGFTQPLSQDFSLRANGEVPGTRTEFTPHAACRKLKTVFGCLGLKIWYQTSWHQGNVHRKKQMTKLTFWVFCFQDLSACFWTKVAAAQKLRQSSWDQSLGSSFPKMSQFPTVFPYLFPVWLVCLPASPAINNSI